MQFDENIFIKKLGEEIGFLAAFILFVSVLYYVLRFFNKIPSSLLYVHILIAVFAIYIIRLITKLIRK